ncbi:MAG: hypothetical protein M0Z66_02180 [Thermaerobacter sp.]|nr:hypothetical protein [Thermaerobacter sp.]
MPWPQVWGCAGFLALTFVAFLLVMHHATIASVLLAVILALALGQSGLRPGGSCAFGRVASRRGNSCRSFKRAAVRSDWFLFQSGGGAVI